MALKASLIALGLMVGALPAVAEGASEWESAFKERRAVSLNTASVPELVEEVEYVPVLVRLHGGVFDFTKVKSDGSDLRFVAEDGVTPLSHHIERFDSVAELGLIWVNIPSLEPAVAQNIHLYTGSNEALNTSSSIAVYGGEYAYVMNMNEDAQLPTDQTANASKFNANNVMPVLDGQIAGAMRFESDSYLRILPSRATNMEANFGQMTWSAWVRLDAASVADEGQAALSDGRIYTKQAADGDDGIVLGVKDNRFYVHLGENEITAPDILTSDAWTHLAVTHDGADLKLFQNGVEVASLNVTLPELNGEEVIGAVGDEAGFVGSLDEVRRSNTARSMSFLAVGVRSQGRNAELVSVSAEAEETTAGHHDYFGILFSALTVDAWVVIIACAIMSLISWIIMFAKAGLFGSTNKTNQRFLAKFKEGTRGDAAHWGLTDETLVTGYQKSSLARLFSIGQEQLIERMGSGAREKTDFVLVPQSVSAIRSTMDTGLAREEQRLSKWLVLLTIAISGGPFLGLLGTVLGVMITFAGVAAAGEVNVTAIAPGIAAALLATVAGLAVAIPALFGYNYLTGQLDNISVDNQVFIDELEKRMAETYRPGKAGGY